jgi:hypothetical protein
VELNTERPKPDDPDPHPPCPVSQVVALLAVANDDSLVDTPGGNAKVHKAWEIFWASQGVGRHVHRVSTVFFNLSLVKSVQWVSLAEHAAVSSHQQS